MTLTDRLHRAQTFGNVGPEEYMVPFPNLGSLLEGKTIKEGNQVLFAGPGGTVAEVQQAVTSWLPELRSRGVEPGTVVTLTASDPRLFLVQAFAVWTLGGILYLGQDPFDRVQIRLSDRIVPSTPEMEFRLRWRPHLETEAVWQEKGDTCIRLSHYNLLINAYALHRVLALPPGRRLLVQAKVQDTADLLCQCLLPLLGNHTLVKSGPDVVIGSEADCTYRVARSWRRLVSTDPPTLYYLPEHTAFVALNEHLFPYVDLRLEDDQVVFSGHAAMLGYATEAETARVLTKEGYRVPLPAI
ncbi:MAG: hypothetical protein D6762_03590 [Candidatus Neomarinimicrobiota bacterium]|nr:MAG: hypothetical protein D6762_03590 [Candidatus Neomarinimicrobiota bacterium]